MNDKTITLTLVGRGEPLLRLQKRLGCAATELGVTLLLDIEKDPGTVGLCYEQTPALLAQGRCIASGLPRTEEIVAPLRAPPGNENGSASMNCLMRAWDSHEAELRAWLRRRLNNTHDAEDLLQDLFIKALRQARNSARSATPAPGCSKSRATHWPTGCG